MERKEERDNSRPLNIRLKVKTCHRLSTSLLSLIEKYLYLEIWAHHDQMYPGWGWFTMPCRSETIFWWTVWDPSPTVSQLLPTDRLVLLNNKLHSLTSCLSSLHTTLFSELNVKPKSPHNFHLLSIISIISVMECIFFSFISKIVRYNQHLKIL